jgi:hypothetical protein
MTANMTSSRSHWGDGHGQPWTADAVSPFGTSCLSPTSDGHQRPFQAQNTTSVYRNLPKFTIAHRFAVKIDQEKAVLERLA